MRVFSALAAAPPALLAPGRWRRRPAHPGRRRAAIDAPRPTARLEIRNGDALVTRVALKTPALRRGTPSLRDVTVDGHRLAELRVPVRGTSAEEVWIGEVSGGASPAPRSSGPA